LTSRKFERSRPPKSFAPFSLMASHYEKAKAAAIAATNIQTVSAFHGANTTFVPKRKGRGCAPPWEKKHSAALSAAAQPRARLARVS
jgi:hypothetical protein